MPLSSSPVHTIHHLTVCLHLPEHFLLLQVKNGQFSLEVPECETYMGGGTGCKGTSLDASGVFDGGYHLKLSFCQLMDLDQSCCPRSLPTEHKLAGVRDPFHVVGSVVETSCEVINNLGGICGLHELQYSLQEMAQSAKNFTDFPEMDDSFLKKSKQEIPSGYIQEEYEQNNDFPSISEYHFRIECDQEILTLQKMQAVSTPIDLKSNFSNGSNSFKQKLDLFLESLDQSAKSFAETRRSKIHGFYTLEQVYPEPQIHIVMEIATQMEKMSVEDAAPKFKRGRDKGVEREMKEMCSKLRHMSISMEDL